MKASSLKKSKARVFLLESDEIVRRCLARLIDAEPDLAVCGTAAGLEEALHLLPAARPDAAVVNVDPLNGGAVAALNQLRWNRPSMPLVAVSMRDASVQGRRMLQAGVAGFVTKAESALRVIPALRRVLKGGTYGLNPMGQQRRKL